MIGEPADRAAQSGDRCGARRLDENAFILCQPKLRLENFFVTNKVNRPVRLFDCALRV
jgi:hypothetical protein